MRGAVAVLVLSAGCADYLGPGELGVLRHFGHVRVDPPAGVRCDAATPPLATALAPPIADRAGNVYVLSESDAPFLDEPVVSIGHASGGWSACACTATPCPLVEGVSTRRVHGWVGFAQDRAWYWAGNGLVEASGATGGCRPVLDRDPGSAAELDFLGIVPWVWDAPSRRSLLALVKSPTDTAPWHVVVDLDRGTYSDVRPFEPRGATEVQVLGTGGDRALRTGAMVVRYDLGGVTRVEGIFFDELGDEVARTALEGLDARGGDAFVGTIQLVGTDSAAGLLDTGDLLLFGPAGGQLVRLASLAAVGVHRWDDALWVAGIAGGVPVVVAADSAASGDFTPWEASTAISESLRGEIEVLDDRTAPRQWITWQSPRTAMGAFPFLHGHSPHPYATGTTGWLIAGPSFDVSGGGCEVAVAFAPAGIAYP